MSDASQGEGWWQASDGKWYGPEQHPDYQPPADAPDTGPPTEATQPPTEVTSPMPPTEATSSMPPVPPTQAMPPMPPPEAPVGPGGPPPGAPGGPPAGRSNAKWIIGGAIALVIIAIAAFLLLRDNGNDNKVSAGSDTNQSSDKSDTNSSTSSKSSSKSTSSSSSKNTVDPATVQDNLLKASDFPAGFTDGQFTPNTDPTDPCGNPSSDAKFPPTKDVGSAIQNTAENEFFQQEVEFYKDAATTKKAFDFAVTGIKQCTQGTIVNSDSTSSFAVSSVKDVSSQVGFTSVEVQFTVDQFSVIEIGVQLDNANATYIFQFPTSAGQSAVPDAIGIAKEGTQKLLS